jgi:hypothetical protein
MTKNLLSTYTIRDTLGNYSRGFKTDGLYQEAAGTAPPAIRERTLAVENAFPRKEQYKEWGE